MSIRKLSVLALACLVALTACKSADGSSSGGGDSNASSSSGGPTYTKFEDFKGKELLFNDTAEAVGMKLKVIDAAWKPEIAGKSAQTGSHFLVAYVAATPEVDDRAAADAFLNPTSLGMRTKGGNCEYPDRGYCYGTPTPTTMLESVADNEWFDHKWQEALYSGGRLEAKETMIGAIALTVSDDEKDLSWELCASTRDSDGQGVSVPELSPCVKVPTPKDNG
ncbi:MAG TPA: hypothetical protein VE172_06165 [Stackebrandtia sp.]|jgi:hypothetical protein|uniref:hypothetical protein n=1 Tax=Stackebrandtia sp. TaxID=2023065 RepID=UPI002D57A334|nr:hypothetical protein [Stackebrandtia sp.]HZE38381.1 hypothetical protein [Stackebrandtia sp.]